MSRNISDTIQGTYFLTLTVVDWVDVFTRPVYRQIFTDSLYYCITCKGLEVYAWVLMSNHAHLVAAAQQGFKLSDIMRDMKKYTSKKIVGEIQIANESRREWMLYRFEYSGKFDPKIKNYRFWQEGNFPRECISDKMLRQKIDYVHENPVRAGIVSAAHHYLHSSAMDYAGEKGLIPVTLAY